GGPDLANVGQQLQAIGARHVEVDERDIDRSGRDRTERLLGAGGLAQLPVGPDAAESARHDHASQLAVVHNEHFILHVPASRRCEAGAPRTPAAWQTRPSYKSLLGRQITRM